MLGVRNLKGRGMEERWRENGKGMRKGRRKGKRVGLRGKEKWTEYGVCEAKGIWKGGGWERDGGKMGGKWERE